MKKPDTFQGYNRDVTRGCERLLVTLIRNMGPWCDSVFLVGGLTPRYLVEDRPPDVPAHAGTSDVDIVVEMQVLADTNAYRTLEENIKRIGLERGENDRGDKLSWRWQKKLDDGTVLILEFLADVGDAEGVALQELPSKGAVSAIGIPHAGMVFDHHETCEITADLLDDGGVTTVNVRHADIVSFTCLKAFACEHRTEPKDAHDLCYCLEHYRGGHRAVQLAFEEALKGKRADEIKRAIDILERHFCSSSGIEGYRKDGPTSAARFEGAESWADDQRIRRQRELSDVVQDAIAPLRRS